MLVSPPSSATVMEEYSYTSTHPLGHTKACNGDTLLLPLLYVIIRSHYGPGVVSASNRNEYQEYFLGLKATDA